MLDAIRVYLGAGLFFRGLVLMLTDTGLQQFTGGAAASLMPSGIALSGIALYVTAAHLVGGALLVVGLYARLAALVQLPILAGAVLLVHWQDGLLSANQSLEFSALVLFLLALVAFFGGGRWSPDDRRSAPDEWRQVAWVRVPLSSRRDDVGRGRADQCPMDVVLGAERGQLLILRDEAERQAVVAVP